MKTTAAILGTAILVAIGSANAGQNDQGEAHKHPEKHEHQKADDTAGEHGEHSGHDQSGGGQMKHAGGHMQHMVEVKTWLKEELGDQYDQPMAEVTDEQLAAGQKTYSTTCVVCHGASGKGDGPAAAAFESKPADFTDAEHSKYYSDQGRMHIIKKGVPGTPMAAWGATLSDADIQAVYAYVRSLRSSEETDEQGHGSHKH